MCEVKNLQISNDWVDFTKDCPHETYPVVQ